MIDVESLRLRIYHQFAEQGRVDSVAMIAADLGLSPEQVASGLAKLARERQVVLDTAGSIVLAHPFATSEFGFSVKSDTTLWWAAAPGTPSPTSCPTPRSSSSPRPARPAAPLMPGASEEIIRRQVISSRTS